MANFIQYGAKRRTGIDRLSAKTESTDRKLKFILISKKGLLLRSPRFCFSDFPSHDLLNGHQRSLVHITDG
jgi:hypothetical protein